MTWQLPPPVLFLLRRVEAAGGEGYLVGGCVRDRLLGRPPGDFDLAVSLTPETVLRVFGDQRTIPTGLAHGTVTVVLEGTPYELTTYRADGPYRDLRHPDSVTFCGRIEQDLARRDFTVNAMAYHPQRGLVDPFGGRADLARRQLKAVGDPALRFSEDALRILRMLRFASQLDFSVEPETEAAAAAAVQGLAAVSPERVYTELKKLLCGPAAGEVLRRDWKILREILPELVPAERDPAEFWAMTGRMADAAPALLPVRMALLFYAGGSDAWAQTAAAEMLRRLRCDRDTRDRVLCLVAHRASDLSPPEMTRWLRRLGPEHLELLLTARRAAALAAGDSETAARMAELEACRRTLLRQGVCYRISQLAVNGEDLLAAGFAPGPALGRRLEALLDGVMDGRVENEASALLDYAAALSIE